MDQTDGVTPVAMAAEVTLDADGVSMAANGSGKKTQLTFANAGTYNIQFSAQLNHKGGGGSGSTTNFWFKLNGNTIASSNTKYDVASSSPFQVAALNFIASVSAGDYIEIFWYTDNANLVLEYLAASGDIPATPSVIITAQQIR